MPVLIYSDFKEIMSTGIIPAVRVLEKITYWYFTVIPHQRLYIYIFPSRGNSEVAREVRRKTSVAPLTFFFFLILILITNV